MSDWFFYIYMGIPQACRAGEGTVFGLAHKFSAFEMSLEKRRF